MLPSSLINGVIHQYTCAQRRSARWFLVILRATRLRRGYGTGKENLGYAKATVTALGINGLGGLHGTGEPHVEQREGGQQQVLPVHLSLVINSADGTWKTVTGRHRTSGRCNVAKVMHEKRV